MLFLVIPVQIKFEGIYRINHTVGKNTSKKLMEQTAPNSAIAFLTGSIECSTEDQHQAGHDNRHIEVKTLYCIFLYLQPVIQTG